MMNVLALFLVLTSIAAAGIFSPQSTDQKKNSRAEDVIVKEGHRLIVVEYEREELGFHKPLEQALPLVSSAFGRANEEFQEASSVLPNLGQGTSSDESIRDAYDKSKEMVDEALCKAHLIDDAAKGARHTAQSVKGAVEDAAKTATEKTKRIPETLNQAKEKVSDKAHSVKEAIGDAKESAIGALGQAKEKVSDKAHPLKEGIGDAKESVTETLSRAKEKVSDKTHSAKEAFEHAKGTVTEKMRTTPETPSHAKEKVSAKAQDLKEAIEESATETMKKISETLNQAKEKDLDKTHSVKDTATETTKTIPETLNQGKEKVLGKTQDFKEEIKDKTSKAKKLVSDKAQDIEEATMEAKDTVTEELNKAKGRISEIAHELKEAAEELATGEKKKDSEDFINRAKEKILNRAHEIKEAAEDVKESVKGLISELKEKVRMTETAITEKRPIHQKVTGFVKEGERNFTILVHRGWEYAVSDENVKWVLGVVRLIGFDTAYGTSVWVTFVSSHLLDGALPRQQFAMVQGKIYPVYFRIMGYTVGSSMVAQILTRPYQSRQSQSSKGVKIHAYDLGIALGFILVNLLFLEPRATKVMFERMKWEKEEGRDGVGVSSTTIDEVATKTEEVSLERRAEIERERAEREEELEKLNQRLKKLNRYSALLNIMTVMALSWHLACLSRCLYMISC